MTRVSLVIFALLSFTLFHGQIREAGTFEIAPVLGYSRANYFDFKGNVYDNVSNINVGVNVDYYLRDRWSFRSGIFYQNMGSKVGPFTERHNFLTIPLNMNWHFGGKRGWNMNFGPNFGYLVSTRSTFNGQVLPDLESLRKFQVGINFGIGYKFIVSKNISILIDYQESAAFTSVFKSSGANIYNNFSSINVGAVFSLQK
jgi:hypothetical protein